jgi:hypothetical protein
VLVVVNTISMFINFVVITTSMYVEERYFVALQKSLLCSNIVTVMLSLCLTMHNAMKSYGGVELYIDVSLTSKLVGGECFALCRSGFLV